jgi:hypothetical protein
LENEEQLFELANNQTQLTNLSAAMIGWVECKNENNYYAKIKLYSAKIYNRALTENEVKKMETGLIREYDGANNYETGHSSSTDSWVDLAKNRNGFSCR